MTYIVKKVIKGNEYFYLVKNIRISEHKWKKYTKYLGKVCPSKRDLKLITTKFEKQMVVLPKFTYISEREAERLQDIKMTFRERYSKFGILGREKFDRDFLVRFTYNTNAIEGNTLTLMETALLLEKGITPAGKAVKEILEAKNMEKCYNFMKNYKSELNEQFVLRLHRIIMRDIMERDAGKYREVDVRITGTEFRPSHYYRLREEMNRFFKWYKNSKNKLHPAELASLVHLKFVTIHPFIDGNGRVARLLSNFVLIKKGFPPIYVRNKDRNEYYETLKTAQVDRNEKPFIKFIVKTLIDEYFRYP